MMRNVSEDDRKGWKILSYRFVYENFEDYTGTVFFHIVSLAHLERNMSYLDLDQGAKS